MLLFRDELKAAVQARHLHVTKVPFQLEETAEHEAKLYFAPLHLPADPGGGGCRVQARPVVGHAMTAILNQSCDALIF